MYKFLTLLSALTYYSVVFAEGTPTLGELQARLNDIECYADSCTYEVLLASMSDPVQYRVRLESRSSESDTLSPCAYLIAWELDAPSGTVEGFSSYFDGEHFRFRDKRLQEYHYGENAEAFAPGGDISKGVQRQAQFCELLPAYIGLQLEQMATDTTYIYEIETKTRNGRKVNTLKGVRRYAGFDALEYEYVFDDKTGRPLTVELETNPGQIGEQSISVKYTGTRLNSADCDISSERLYNEYPDAFGKYRESSFSLETLPGRPLPSFTAPSTGTDRYTYTSGQVLASPTMMVFLDASIATTPTVISDVRSALEVLPVPVDIIWAFINNRYEDIESVMSAPAACETILLHSTGVAGRCGVGSNTPAMLFIGADGIVKDFINGYNQDLRSLVIEKASLIGR